MEIEKCKGCNRPFEVQEQGGQMPGTKEPEDISCPYCGYTRTQRSNGYFRTWKLSEERERQWLTENGGDF